MKYNLQTTTIIAVYTIYITWICYTNFFFDNVLSPDIIDTSFALIHWDHLYYSDVIFKRQNEIISGDLSKIFNMYDYGYSWLFWFIQIVITFPAFLLYKFYGFDFLYTTTPRMVTVLLGVVTVHYFYKILSLYKIEPINKTLIMLLPITCMGFTSFMFWRFGPSVFCGAGITIASYFILKNNYSPRNIHFLSLTTAFALGGKISASLFGIFAVPAVLYQNYKNKKNIIPLSCFLLLFCTLAINPGIFFNAQEFFNNVLHWSKFAGDDQGQPHSFFRTLYWLFKNYGSLYGWCLFLPYALYRLYKEKEIRPMASMLLFGIVFSTIFICLKITAYRALPSNQYISTFVLFIPLLALLTHNDKTKIGTLFLSLLIIFSITFNHFNYWLLHHFSQKDAKFHIIQHSLFALPENNISTLEE